MCGRFTLGKPKEIETRFQTKNKLTRFNPSWNVAPSQIIPTITRNSPNKITMMKWGFLFSKTTNFGTINIRSESTKEKPFFKHFLMHKRCIIPSDGFYEWGTVNLEGNDEKYPFYFYLKDRLLFGFAALFNDFPDAEGKLYFSCAILTCPPNEVLNKVHNRMPVILKKEDEDKWLDPGLTDFESIYKFLVPYPHEDMKFNLVSKRVNSPRNDNEGLIDPFALDQLKI
jgi:putative SOS response-associated peptidase YedK